MDFATENLVIISSKFPIQMIQWRAHLNSQWEQVMKENTRLLVVAGTHGREDGQLGENDQAFADQSERFLVWFERKYKQDIEDKNIVMKIEDIGEHKDGRDKEKKKRRRSASSSSSSSEQEEREHKKKRKSSKSKNKEGAGKADGPVSLRAFFAGSSDDSN